MTAQVSVVSSANANSTSTASINKVWHKGISEGVSFTALIAAIRAIPKTSPFTALRFSIINAVAGSNFTCPNAVAVRSVSDFPETSTIFAFPDESK